MLTKRIIACLDVKDGRVVKGVQFRNHVDMGDILELSQRYADEVLMSWYFTILPPAVMAGWLIKAGLIKSPAGSTFPFVWRVESEQLSMPVILNDGAVIKSIHRHSTLKLLPNLPRRLAHNALSQVSIVAAKRMGVCRFINIPGTRLKRSNPNARRLPGRNRLWRLVRKLYLTA